MAEVALDIAGLGIIVYSPSSAAHIAEGEDYLQPHYWDPDDVQRHIQAGSIVGFGTGGPGAFRLLTHTGYPTEPEIDAAELTLRLGLRCDGRVVFRDLYDLMDWTAEFPPDQAIDLAPGIYHLTLVSNLPPSGLHGDEQIIDLYVQELDEFPALADIGVPGLC